MHCLCALEGKTEL